MSNKSWQDYFLGIAEQVKTRSKDKNTNIGAVIVDEGNIIISTGYNSFPRGIDDNVPERQERPEKYFWFAHAERNAIYAAAKKGISTDGTTMYLTCGVPCTGCAIAIIQAGIKRVYFKKGAIITHSQKTNVQKWREEADRSMEMFDEAGVEMIAYENDLH
jgi:dCMP deaminase